MYEEVVRIDFVTTLDDFSHLTRQLQDLQSLMDIGTINATL